MKTLLLMRHAKSDWKQPGLSDHDRPLNARGRKATPVMARQLCLSGLQADVILASSAVRVQETIELLRHQWSPQAEVLTCRSLYLASPQQIMSEVQGQHDSWQTVMVVGHNPGMQALVSQLSGLALDFPTAAVAAFQWPETPWSRIFASGQAKLIAYWKPRDLMG